MSAKRKPECPPGMNYLEWHSTCVKERKQAKEERKQIKLGLDPKKQAKPRTGPLGLPEGYDMEDTAMSFDEWKACGRCVKKRQQVPAHRHSRHPAIYSKSDTKNQPRLGFLAFKIMTLEKTLAIFRHGGMSSVPQIMALSIIHRLGSITQMNLQNEMSELGYSAANILLMLKQKNMVGVHYDSGIRGVATYRLSRKAIAIFDQLKAPTATGGNRS